MENSLPDWVRTGVFIFIVLYFNYQQRRDKEKNVKRHEDFFWNQTPATKVNHSDTTLKLLYFMKKSRS